MVPGGGSQTKTEAIGVSLPLWIGRVSILRPPAGKPGTGTRAGQRGDHTGGEILEWRQPGDSLLGISLENLISGRAWLNVALEKSPLDVSPLNHQQTRAKTFLDEAVAGLREAGQQQYLPLGLLARAGYYRCTQEYAKAHDDLKEVRDIAELGGMKLFLCDYHLEMQKLCVAEGKMEEAEKHEKKAGALIEETGDGRRKNNYK